MNKKAGYQDLFLFMIIGFVLAICCVLFYFIGTTAYTKIQEKAPMMQEMLGDEYNATEIVADTFGKVPQAYEALKWITVMLIGGMMLSILISSYMVRTKPVYFVGYIMLVIIAVIISVPLSNAYETIYENPTLASSFTGFWGQTYIFLNLPIWITVIGILAGILMYVNMGRGVDVYYG